MSAFGGSQAAPVNNPNNSVEIAPPFNDSVSSLEFSSKSNLLMATSWENKIRIWDILANGSGVPKAEMAHDQPVLCSSWKDDGMTVFTAGCDKSARMWPLGSLGNFTTVAMHDAPIRHIEWIKELNMIVTGSWDKTLKYWDLRSSTPVHTQPLPERVYGMSLQFPLLTIGTADRSIILFDMGSPQKELKRVPSMLKNQTRCVATFPDKQGFLVGSIEGRVAVQYLDENQPNKKSFTFKCHREGPEIFPVNSICFHPYGTFATAGGDGAMNIWDKDSKQRLKNLNRCPNPITCGNFNMDGTIYAYATGYDWSKGAENFNASAHKPQIYVHPILDNEARPKPKSVGSTKR